MAPKRASTYSLEEEAVQNAVKYFHDHKGTTASKAAEIYDAPYRRVLNRLNGVPSKNELSNHTKLTQTEEQLISNQLHHLDELGFRATRPILTDMANNVLSLRNDSEDPSPSQQRVGVKWASRYQKRHQDEFIWKKQKPLSADRNRITPEVIRDHINKLLDIEQKYGIAASDKWNFDETGFRIGVGGTVDVITSIANRRKRLYMSDPENRTHLTAIECCNATGTVLPPLLIYKGETILQADIQPTMPGDWAHTCSPSGYANEVIMMAWLERFELQTRKLRTGRFRLLIFDGFDAHTDFKFVRFCQLHDIVPYQLPSHSTHLLQPLDVGCFQPLKHYHGQAIASEVRSGADTFTRQDFLFALRDIRKETFTEKTIIHAWKKSGCHPVDVDIIINRLPIYEDSSSDSEDESGYDEQYAMTPYSQPPSSYRAFQKRGEWLRTCLANIPLPEYLREGLDVYITAAECASATAQLATKELDTVLERSSLRTKRKQMGQKQVAKGRILSIGESRAIITQRIVKEAKPKMITQKMRKQLDDWIISCARVAAEYQRLRGNTTEGVVVHLPLIVKFKRPDSKPLTNKWDTVIPAHYNIGRTGGDHIIQLSDSPGVYFHRVGDLPLILDPPRPSPYRTGFELLADTIDIKISKAQQKDKEGEVAAENQS
jgi:hypothetical protein